MDPNISILDAIKMIDAPAIQNEGYKIKSLLESIWAFEKLHELQNKKTEIITVAESLITEKTKKINAWVSNEIKPLDESIEFFKIKILQYYREQADENPKFKLTTPYGQVTKRTSKKWNYDEEKILQYLKANEPELIKITEEIKKAELKKKYPDGINTETGEIIAGIEIENVTNIDVKVGL